jgi:hypothetical protein
MSNDRPMNQQPPFDDNHVVVTPGAISYWDHQGKPQRFYFQCNPTSLTRSRSVTRTTTKAGNKNSGTTTKPGEAGKKFTHDAGWWQFDSFEIWFDASNPQYAASPPPESPPDAHKRDPASWSVTPLPRSHKREEPKTMKAATEAVMAGIKHLEALCEPGHMPTENEHQLGWPPAPSPPSMVLWFGERAWAGYVKSVTILEKEFTPDLIPKLVKATLSLELIPVKSKLDMGKFGGEL